MNKTFSITIAACLLTLCCGRNIRLDSCSFNIIITSPDDVRIDLNIIKSAFNKKFAQTGRDCLIEVSIYKYSSGKEIYRYSGKNGEEVTVHNEKAYIEAMVRAIRKTETIDIKFIRGSGNSRESAIDDLISRIGKTFVN
jgi:hypothetical protein